MLKVPETGAKRKLLDAAEELVAEKGFDLVSVRDVTGAVKANVAAVNYHFGSREGLMDVVVGRVVEPLCEEWWRGLNALVGRAEGGLVEGVVRVYVDAFGAAARGMGMEEGRFFRLVGRVLVLPESALAPSFAFSLREVRERFLELLGGALRGAGAEELRGVWGFFEGGVAQGLLSGGGRPEEWVRIGIRSLGVGLEAEAETAEEPAEEAAAKEAGGEVMEAPGAEVPEEVRETQELFFDF